MLRKEREAVPEGKLSNPLYVLPGGISLENLRRLMRETWNKVREKNGLKKPGKLKEMICMVITYSRVWLNRVRLPILHVVS